MIRIRLVLYGGGAAAVLVIFFWILSVPASHKTAQSHFLVARSVEDAAARTAHREGVTAALDFMASAYQTMPAFRPFCHGTALNLADRVYASSTDVEALTLGPQSADCNYGFYQEYPRAMLAATGDVSAAAAFCTRAGEHLNQSVPGLEAECFRGIGRGLVSLASTSAQSIHNRAAFAVSTCGNIASREKKIFTLESAYENCIAGAFNMLGRTVADGGAGLAESVLASSLCESQPDPLVRGRCVGNFKWSYLLTADLSKAAEVFARVEKEGSSTAMLHATAWTIGYDQTEKSLADPEALTHIIQLCRTLPKSFTLDCVQGAGVSLAKNGFPGSQHLQVISFCTLAGQMLQANPSECVSSQTLQYLQGFYSPARFKAACVDFAKIGVSCPLE